MGQAAKKEKDALREEYGVLHCTPAQLAELDPGAILGRRETPYGVEALVRRETVPAGSVLSAVSIEDLFVFMVKGGKKE